MTDNLEEKSKNNTGQSVNEAVKSRQLKFGIFIVVGFIGVVALLVNVSEGTGEPDRDVRKEDLTVTVQRSPNDKDNFTTLSGQVNGLLGEMNKYKSTNERMNAFLDKQGNESKLSDIQSTLNGAESLLEDLTSRIDQIEKNGIGSGTRNTFGPGPGDAKRGLEARAGSDVIRARPSNADDIFAPSGRIDRRAEKKPKKIPEIRRQNVINLFAESEGETLAETKEVELYGNQTNAEKPMVYDTKNYVPPNAYVSARLVVSVDAPIGQGQTADPKAAQFIITGPAQHVQDGGIIEKTDMEGCLVNGSAQGNLSSERVFINLHAMTCPLGDGKVAVSKVEGYATHLGKNGIRGTVVSREGDLVTKAILAGTLEGLGNVASRQGVNNSFGGTGGGLLGERPSVGEAVTGAIGSGIAAGAGSYSEYLLERARAYEPVVSLPTGIDVELVFISGSLVRPTDQ